MPETDPYQTNPNAGELEICTGDIDSSFSGEMFQADWSQEPRVAATPNDSEPTAEFPI